MAETTQALRCPTAEQTDLRPGEEPLTGCGSTNLSQPASDGYIDCGDCGIDFNPATEYGKDWKARYHIAPCDPDCVSCTAGDHDECGVGCHADQTPEGHSPCSACFDPYPIEYLNTTAEGLVCDGCLDGPNMDDDDIEHGPLDSDPREGDRNEYEPGGMYFA